MLQFFIKNECISFGRAQSVRRTKTKTEETEQKGCLDAGGLKWFYWYNYALRTKNNSVKTFFFAATPGFKNDLCVRRGINRQ